MLLQKKKIYICKLNMCVKAYEMDNCNYLANRVLQCSSCFAQAFGCAR